MSYWTPITLANLRNAKVAALVNALNTAALGSGQTERASEITQSVVDRIRRKIGSHPGNRLDSDTTKIPNGLKDDAVKLILADLKNALEEPLTKDESDEVARINTDLNRIAAGTDAVEQPDTPVVAPVEGAVAIRVVSSTTRQATRERMTGL